MCRRCEKAVGPRPEAAGRTDDAAPRRFRRAFRAARPGRRAAGFTLLEVLAALLVAAVAITYLLGSQIDGLRLVSATRELREATLLAKEKMQELAAGIEASDAGTFEGRDRWSWETRREQVQEALGMSKIILTVTYVAAGGERTLELEQIVP